MSPSDVSESREGTETPESIFTSHQQIEISRRDRFERLFSEIKAAFKLIWSDWRGALGLSIIITYVLIATVGVEVIAPPTTDLEHKVTPAFQVSKYPLGTDSAGRGILNAVVHATPAMLKMILAGGIFATMFGALVGTVAGYKRGVVDQILMAFTDILMTLPGLPLIIVISFIITPRNPYIIGIILAINNWTGLARAVRSQVTPLRNIEYIEAARLMDIPLRRIVPREILPNIMPYISVAFVFASRRIIFESVGLYFLGILPTNEPNWGVMLNQAYSNGAPLYSFKALHWLVTPMLAIVTLSMGFVLLAQSADKMFNPQLRAKQKSADEKPTGEDSDNVMSEIR